MKQHVQRFAVRGVVATMAFGAIVPAPIAAPRSRATAIGQFDYSDGPARTPISPQLYGLMTEGINHSYDGGLYAELIQNRAFSFRTKQQSPFL